jgi:hypothetical protein
VPGMRWRRNARGGFGETVSFEFTGDPEDGSPVGATALIAVHAEYFSCPTCHLVLDDFELIVQAGLPDSFVFVDEDPEWPDEEPEYGND